MTKHLKHIGKQLTIFALIASIFNIYALEIWCGLTMGNGAQWAMGSEHQHHIANASLLPEKVENCPHQGTSEDDENSCDDHHNFFLTALTDGGNHKFEYSADGFQFILPNHLNLFSSHSNSLLALPVRLFPDVGLKPKIPDIRIFICSLTI